MLRHAGSVPCRSILWLAQGDFVPAPDCIPQMKRCAVWLVVTGNSALVQDRDDGGEVAAAARLVIHGEAVLVKGSERTSSRHRNGF